MLVFEITLFCTTVYFPFGVKMIFQFPFLLKDLMWCVRENHDIELLSHENVLLVTSVTELLTIL